jgi:hypothetical protein
MFSLSQDGRLQLEIRGVEPGTKLVYLLSDPHDHPTLVRDDRPEKLKPLSGIAVYLPLLLERLIRVRLFDPMQRQGLNLFRELAKVVSHPRLPRVVQAIIERSSR